MRASKSVSASQRKRSTCGATVTQPTQERKSTRSALTIRVVGKALSAVALGPDEKCHFIDLELASQASSKKAKPILLSLVGESLSLLRTGVGETGKILKMMHDLMDEDG